MSAENATYRILAADATVAGIVGTKITAGRMKPDTSAPYITYRRISTEATHTIGAEGDDGTPVVRMQVESWANSHVTARTLADAVHAALNKYAGTIGGDVIRWIQDEPGSNYYHQDYGEAGKTEPIYAVFQDFLIWINRS